MCNKEQGFYQSGPNDYDEWVDFYWNLIDDGYTESGAILRTCVNFGLSSYEEELLKDIIRND